MNDVIKVPAAAAEEALSYFSRQLSFETDCSDVHEALASGTPGFVLLDVRGKSSYDKMHVPEALNLPHREISKETLASYPQKTLFVVYCAGPHCNGATKAALKLAALRRPVKIMIGGLKGWQDEGFFVSSH